MIEQQNRFMIRTGNEIVLRVELSRVEEREADRIVALTDDGAWVVTKDRYTGGKSQGQQFANENDAFDFIAQRG